MRTFIFLVLTLAIPGFIFCRPFVNYDKEPLKAVIIVGPQEDETSTSIKDMYKVVEFLKSKGVVVHCYYDRNTDWNQIVKASQDASILIYDGHGSDDCGFNLKESVSAVEIKKSLHLKKNALVLFQSVCNGAGSSAGDLKDIGLAEAERRVTKYAKTFIESGAGCYFAINSVDGVYDFLNDFFDGSTVNKCFENSAEDFYDIEKVQNSSLGQNLHIGIASSYWEGTNTLITYTNGVKKVEKVPSVKSYNIAYISKKDFSLKNLEEN